jgi:hypothetical protein
MPTVTAYPYPALGRVLVEIDWADTDFVTCARAVRHVVSTGATAALRSYIAPCGTNGEYQELSGGRAIFWDNECPLDTPVYYTTDASTTTGLPSAQYADSYTRVTANGWGTADSGQIWSTAIGAAGILSTNGTSGLHTHSVANTEAGSSLAVSGRDFDAKITASVSSIANYGEVGLAFRWVDNNNYIKAVLGMDLAPLTLIQKTAGVSVTIATVSGVLVPAAATPYMLRAAVAGSTFKAKAWVPPNAEPDWQVTGTITSPDTPSGALAITSNDLVAAKTFTFDDLVGTINDGVAITATSSTITLASNNNMWLRDPGRPCNDLLVQLCFSGPCASGNGVAFMGIDTETYDANTTLLVPTNAKYPIPINRQRRDANSTITLSTKTFTDRDALKQFLAPGDPVLFSTPSVYGIPDRYLSIAATTIAHGLTDLKNQKRLEQLPFTTVERPVTTQQGTCNAQFSAMCTVYSTWTAMASAGITWSDVHYGMAGGSPSLGFRIWNPGVENVFANWLAVETHGTWGQLKTGA